ncbi:MULTISPECIES: response regulator transcription factor [unclassified Colwellia]|uniref:response regulator transcription factor n=1 Tax=unclassified Colwellia TaxID=196834 RepID=UPI0015F3655D|nr:MULTISPECIES: response regulator transcription factor [unclassified Colwellia]MBA6338697.1 response regulator transcription factor [Colwellia sp. BRX8-7]MBA6380100.1 response regulator transcription factor [Colwellia sp. BRX10-7]MBA6387312.1 response regulator transcription factor [Colwellia sp. BRX10-2]MBA6402399.1 response regulator transcription factor [Colwellia sp. BRX10-5]MBA6406669.1 response regulator transcription factor [Colwellia sp. BRX10-1]
MKILIIEDSTSLRRSLKIGLSNLGFTVDDTGDGSEGLSMALAGDYSLLILDLMLPSVDGTAILKAIRKANKDLRVLILSARDLTEDKISGLLNGADDYLTKPFSFDELHVRLLCLMRRGSLNINDSKINIGVFSLDIHLKQLLCNGINAHLTPNEYKLVECLFTNQGKVVSPEKLSDYLAGQYNAVAKNSIEAHLSTTRKKVRDIGHDLPIKTKRGFGYFVEKN